MKAEPQPLLLAGAETRDGGRELLGSEARPVVEDLKCEGIHVLGDAADDLDVLGSSDAIAFTCVDQEVRERALKRVHAPADRDPSRTFSRHGGVIAELHVREPQARLPEHVVDRR